MNRYVEITRFSDDGFKDQLQNYHIEQVNYLKSMDWLSDLDKMKINNNLRNKTKNINRNRLENINDDFKYGIFCFIKWREDSYFLNHLDSDEIFKLPCWEAKIPTNATVYMAHEPFLKSSITTVGRESDRGAEEIFIPKISLKLIYDVKEINNIFLENVKEKNFSIEA